LKNLRLHPREERPKDGPVVQGVLRRSNCASRLILLVAGLCQTLNCQTHSPGSPADPESCSYEVATVKPSDGDGFAPTLRMYIVSAFGAQHLSSGQVIGPDWIDKKRYEIVGKPSDSMREAMSKMSREERLAQSNLLMQSLLADRFKLRFHIEKRELPVYKLVLAKGGLKLKEHSDAARMGVTMRGNGEFHEIRGTATIPDLIGLLMNNVLETDGRPITNATGLVGTFYDFSLRWSTAEVTAISDSSDAPSLFTAVQEQLGFRLVAAKAPLEAIVIDHIELPSAN